MVGLGSRISVVASSCFGMGSLYHVVHPLLDSMSHQMRVLHNPLFELLRQELLPFLGKVTHSIAKCNGELLGSALVQTREQATQCHHTILVTDQRNETCVDGSAKVQLNFFELLADKFALAILCLADGGCFLKESQNLVVLIHDIHGDGGFSCMERNVGLYSSTLCIFCQHRKPFDFKGLSLMYNC